MEKPHRNFGSDSGFRSAPAQSRREEDDYIVPRSGNYFEHDDRDVWQPRRGGRQGGYTRGQRHNNGMDNSFDHPAGKYRDRSQLSETRFRPYQIYEQARNKASSSFDDRNQDRTYSSRRNGGAKPNGGLVDYENNDNGGVNDGWNNSAGREKRLRSKIEDPSQKRIRSKVEYPSNSGKWEHEELPDRMDEDRWDPSKRRRHGGSEDGPPGRFRPRESWNSDRDQNYGYNGNRGGRNHRAQDADGWASFSRGGHSKNGYRRAPSPDVWKHDMFEEINKEPEPAQVQDDVAEAAPQQKSRGKLVVANSQDEENMEEATAMVNDVVEHDAAEEEDAQDEEVMDDDT